MALTAIKVKRQTTKAGIEWRANVNTIFSSFNQAECRTVLTQQQKSIVTIINQIFSSKTPLCVLIQQKKSKDKEQSENLSLD